jgi:crotonobetainyl-CoA:carnitine CoA-transferase CaiB-like acyl-CoA transferase
MEPLASILSGQGGTAPLAGLRVLDLSRALAGPYGTLVLGDLGAEIIKIEPYPDGDQNRRHKQRVGGESLNFLSVNRNKQSVVMNLKSDRGRALFYDLVKVSDIVYDNFRPGVLERLGLDYDTLSEINPRIISCSVSGFGHSGPLAQSPAYDLIIQALSGAMSFTGEPGRPPVRSAIPIADLGGGMFGAIGILAALQSRHQTGRGARIDISLLDVQISMLVYYAAWYLNQGIEPQPVGAGHPANVPYNVYPTKDGYIAIAARDQKFWTILCQKLDLADFVEDKDYIDEHARRDNRDALEAILVEHLTRRSTEEWLGILSGIPCSPVNSVGQALNLAQVKDRNMVIELDHPTAGALRFAGNPVKIGGMQEASAPPPRLGEHTETVLRSLLGLGAQECAELIRSGVIRGLQESDGAIETWTKNRQQGGIQ